MIMQSNSLFPTNLTVLLEPTADCNIRCRHCYHADTGYDTYKMSIKTLQQFIKRSMRFYKSIKIIWHGGEPLLMGHQFFCNAYKLFSKESAEYKTVTKFNVQTNAILLDDEYIEFFVNHNTNISISYDGPYNSVLRQETLKTENAIDKLKKRGHKIYCLSTISSKSIGHLVELYNFFKQENINVKFNPLFPDGAALCNSEFIISKEDWYQCFIEFFDYWFHDVNCNIVVASCLELLKRTLTSHLGCPGACLYQYIAVDAYGNLYPCGRLVDPNFLICNIEDVQDIRQAFIKEAYNKLAENTKIRIDQCGGCKWLNQCHCGCNATAYLGNGINSRNEFDCYFNQRVFSYIDKLLKHNTLTNINPTARNILERHQG